MLKVNGPTDQTLLYGYQSPHFPARGERLYSMDLLTQQPSTNGWRETASSSPLPLPVRSFAVASAGERNQLKGRRMDAYVSRAFRQVVLTRDNRAPWVCCAQHPSTDGRSGTASSLPLSFPRGTARTDASGCALRDIEFCTEGHRHSDSCIHTHPASLQSYPRAYSCKSRARSADSGSIRLTLNVVAWLNR